MEPTAPPCLSEHGGACRLLVAVVPNARRTGADGLHDGCLRVRLAAPPVEGKANERLLAWLADELDLPKRAVSLLRGDTARRKQIEIDAPPAVVAAWLVRVLAPTPSAQQAP
ncbi:conserved hypothetical protein [Rubrivivax sp. A210]|uniref:DUF167 domain-containing protein n=1 Tax=Rubrivivax sp. A210 TaxID=2772301 RepID=UPI001918F74C|nr:DUF167 domain-containing protein [Rubrivivax sp. A210]CAD5371808.1 conserved hypothetical protein [Rubrivivax sp. A210]